KKDAPPAMLAKEGLGLCAEAQNKLDEALATYQSLEPKQGDFFRDRALFNQARIYKKKGDKKRAAELYGQIISKMPQTQLKAEVRAALAPLDPPRQDSSPAPLPPSPSATPAAPPGANCASRSSSPPSR